MAVKYLDSTGLGYVWSKFKAWCNATFAAITHNQASNTINTMTGYSKPSSGSAIATSDSLNSAIGKLEAKVDAVTAPTIPDLSRTISGSGNAITDITVSGHAITATKGSTFITSSGGSLTGALDSTSYYKGSSFYNCLASVTKGTNPPDGIVHYWVYGAYDKNGFDYVSNCLGLHETNLQSSGRVSTYMRALRNEVNSADAVTIGCFYDKNGTQGYTFADAELQITSPNANQLRLAHNNYGIIFRNDSNDFYILQTAIGDPWGGWNNARPLTINLATGVCNINGNANSAYKLEMASANTASTSTNTYAFGSFNVRWFTEENMVPGQPTRYGFLATFATGDNASEIHQIWCSQANGDLYHRGTNAGSYTSPPPFKKIIDSSNNDYVTVASIQDVTGYKKFWKDFSLYYFGYNLETSGITEDKWWSLAFHTGDSSAVGGIWKALRASDNASYVSMRSYRFNGDKTYSAFHVNRQGDGTGYCNFTNVSNVRPQTSGSATLGTGNIRWGTIYTTGNVQVSSSDERIKTQIADIPDELLDAWENLEYKQFKMTDSIKEKGDNARLHTGCIAQQAKQIFKNTNIDVDKYGFFCWDEWDAKEAFYDEEGRLVEPAIEAGDLYSLRYGELACIEAAYQRRKNKILEKRISELETQVQNMLQVLESLKGA